MSGGRIRRADPNQRVGARVLTSLEVTWHANIHDDMKGVPDLITRMSRMRFSCQVAVVSFA